MKFEKGKHTDYNFSLTTLFEFQENPHLNSRIFNGLKFMHIMVVHKIHSRVLPTSTRNDRGGDPLQTKAEPPPACAVTRFSFSETPTITQGCSRLGATGSEDLSLRDMSHCAGLLSIPSDLAKSVISNIEVQCLVNLSKHRLLLLHIAHSVSDLLAGIVALLSASLMYISGPGL
ncbi:hypothetical protein SKAU_G00017050 [Synaphobranchus kaupii]|uniref:Uncharacterized protein n=1 Tax=Synaphobranchus kaupii TaxID=118154 RepID=A0A9Q1GCY1_SYNKA|nr:hypothetical protein SKAU_G00017050 [Synaphobranchus kaupii]